MHGLPATLSLLLWQPTNFQVGSGGLEQELETGRWRGRGLKDRYRWRGPQAACTGEPFRLFSLIFKQHPAWTVYASFYKQLLFVAVACIYFFLKNLFLWLWLSSFRKRLSHLVASPFCQGLFQCRFPRSVLGRAARPGRDQRSLAATPAQ